MIIKLKQSNENTKVDTAFESLVKEGEKFMNEIAELDELLNSLIIDDIMDEEDPDYDYVEIDR